MQLTVNSAVTVNTVSSPVVEVTVRPPVGVAVIAVSGPMGPSGAAGVAGTGSANLSGYITTGQADLRYYPLDSNPSGYFRDNVVLTTGAQLISGVKRFATGIHVSGDGVYFDTPTSPSWKEGLTFYDQTEHALSYYNDAQDVTVNIGQEMLIRVVNRSSVDILNGQPVYISGAQGNRPQIWLAIASSSAAENVIGVATHDIDRNQNGYIATQGIVRGLNMSAFFEGDALYLSPTVSGALTSTSPAAPNIAVKIGTVLNNSASIGTLYVNPEVDSSHMNNIHDVYINSGTLQNGDYLTYNSTGAYWTNTRFPSGYATSGNLGETGSNLYNLITGVSGYSSSPLYSVRNLSGNYTILATDQVIVFNSISGVTGTLPTPSTARFNVKNMNTGTVLITGVGSLIDNGVNAILYQYDSILLQGNPPNWIIL